MQCSQCRFESFHGTKFCKKCGNKLELLCPSRDHPDQIDSIFCDECGYNFKLAKETSDQISETERHPFSPSENKPFNDVDRVTGERKQMTGIIFPQTLPDITPFPRSRPRKVKKIPSRFFRWIDLETEMTNQTKKIPLGLHLLFLILSGILAVFCEIVYFRHIEKAPGLHILLFISVPVAFYVILRLNYRFICFLRKRSQN